MAYRLLTPWRPGKVVCIGRNYAAHIEELRNAKPKKPFFFLKPPTSIRLPPLLGSRAFVWRPRGVDLHYEVELAILIGKTIKDLDAEDELSAYDSIFGYAVGIDMTARNIQDEAKAKGLPWDIAKDPHNVELYLDVNGNSKQCDSTGLMIFRIPTILSEISKTMTLLKGDIVLTGTPKGVGPVVPGDVMTAGIRVDGEELVEGKIETHVVESTSSYIYEET